MLLSMAQELFIYFCFQILLEKCNFNTYIHHFTIKMVNSEYMLDIRKYKHYFYFPITLNSARVVSTVQRQHNGSTAICERYKHFILKIQERRSTI